MAITIPNIEQIRTQDPRLAEALEYIGKAMQNVASQTGSDPSQQEAAPPPQVQALSVAASGGIFDVKLTDTSPISRNINYFAEYSTTPGFQQPTVIDLGATRNTRVHLGNQTLYWRAYSQYRSGSPSPPVYHGTQVQPAAVQGGGSIIGPVPLPSSGSGTANSDGTQGAAGFGIIPARPNK